MVGLFLFPFWYDDDTSPEFYSAVKLMPMAKWSRSQTNFMFKLFLLRILKAQISKPYDRSASYLSYFSS